MTEEQEGKPKIIVDDDWKERVQAEKEAAQSATEENQQEASSEQLPPASISMLISSLATQALMGLGRIPYPEGEAVFRPDYARHAIDMLGVLEEKTKGNLTTQESEMMQQVLHELRMTYLDATKQPTASADENTDAESE